MARTPKKSTGVVQYPASKAWGVDYRDEHGKRIRKKVGSRDDALNYYAEIQRRLRVGEVLPDKKKRQRLTIGDLAELVAERTSNRDSKRETLEWGSSNGKLYPTDLTGVAIQEWIDEALHSYKHGTVRRKLSALQAIFTLAEERGEIDRASNPFAMRKAFRMPKQRDRIRYLSDAEEKLLKKRMGSWFDYALFAILTGLRWTNQADLTWPYVDLEQAYVVIPDTKNDEQQVLPLNQEAVALLRRQQARNPSSDYCFPGTSGARLSQSWWGKKWRGWLEPVVNEDGKVISKAIENFHWHDLRHTCASRLRQAGVPLGHISVILNHKDLRMTQRYAHIGESDIRRSMELLQNGRILDALSQ